MKNQDNHLQQDRKAKETGNVFFIILIALMLLLGLSRAVIKDSGGGANIGDKGQAKVAASQILKYARSVENAIKQLQLVSGCSENEISFENNEVVGYGNANAPADESCHIFHPNGGGLMWQTAPPSATSNTVYSINPRNGVDGIGTSNPDLIIQLRSVNLATCNEINNLLGWGSAPLFDSYGFEENGKFYGTYASSNLIKDDIGNSIEGKSTGCFEGESSSNDYYFYHVLLAR